MNRRHNDPPGANQRGYALILALLVLALASLYSLFDRLSPTAQKTQGAQNTAHALHLAKQALLGYAITYRDTHAGEAYGYLPCPDTHDASNPGLVGTADSTCGAAGSPSIGLLPYRTLGLPALRDSDGNCLWYAVSGTHKNNPKNGTLNWDTRGSFRIVDASGKLLQAPDDAQGGAVAVIFAPGPPLGLSGNPQASRRLPIATPCATDPAAASAYLESLASPFVGGERMDLSGQPLGNDRLSWLTAGEIFALLRKRTDFATYINLSLSKIQGELNQQLDAAAQSQPPGRPPAPPASLAGDNADFYRQWQDQLRYLVCPGIGTHCYNLGGQRCDGVMLFAGEDTSGNPRPATAYANGNYFESALALADGGLSLNSMATAYAPTSLATRSQDLVFCLAPLNGSVGLGDLLAVAPAAGNGVQISGGSAPQLSLGNPGYGAAIYGCAWSAQAMPWRRGLRIYFRFSIQERGQGFTLAIADARSNAAAAMCGNAGSALGYSGNNAITTPIRPPKLALEFDTSQQNASPANSPPALTRNDPSNHHAAVIFWGPDSPDGDLDNTHGQCGAATAPGSPAPPCNPNAAAAGLQSLALLDKCKHNGGNCPSGDIHVRIDIVPDAASAQSYTLSAYLTDSTAEASACAFDSDFGEDIEQMKTCTRNPDLRQSFATDMTNAYIGFSFGQTANSGERIVIDRFKAQAR